MSTISGGAAAGPTMDDKLKQVISIALSLLMVVMLPNNTVIAVVEAYSGVFLILLVALIPLGLLALTANVKEQWLKGLIFMLAGMVLGLMTGLVSRSGRNNSFTTITFPILGLISGLLIFIGLIMLLSAGVKAGASAVNAMRGGAHPAHHGPINLTPPAAGTPPNPTTPPADPRHGQIQNIFSALARMAMNLDSLHAAGQSDVSDAVAALNGGTRNPQYAQNYQTIMGTIQTNITQVNTQLRTYTTTAGPRSAVSRADFGTQYAFYMGLMGKLSAYNKQYSDALASLAH